MRKHRRNPGSVGNLLLKLPQPGKGMPLGKIYSSVLGDHSKVEPYHTHSKKKSWRISQEAKLLHSLFCFCFGNPAAHRWCISWQDMREWLHWRKGTEQEMVAEPSSEWPSCIAGSFSWGQRRWFWLISDTEAHLTQRQTHTYHLSY